MRHWSPWIEEVVGEMVDDGVEGAVGVVLAPQFSGMSVARYQQKVEDGLDLYRGRMELRHVTSYHDADLARQCVRVARSAGARTLARGAAG